MYAAGFWLTLMCPAIIPNTDRRLKSRMEWNIVAPVMSNVAEKADNIKALRFLEVLMS